MYSGLDIIAPVAGLVGRNRKSWWRIGCKSELDASIGTIQICDLDSGRVHRHNIREYMFIDRDGEYRTIAVVYMLSDKVDPSRRSQEIPSRRVDRWPFASNPFYEEVFNPSQVFNHINKSPKHVDACIVRMKGSPPQGKPWIRILRFLRQSGKPAYTMDLFIVSIKNLLVSPL